MEKVGQEKNSWEEDKKINHIQEQLPPAEVTRIVDVMKRSFQPGI